MIAEFTWYVYSCAARIMANEAYDYDTWKDIIKKSKLTYPPEGWAKQRANFNIGLIMIIVFPTAGVVYGIIAVLCYMCMRDFIYDANIDRYLEENIRPANRQAFIWYIGKKKITFELLMAACDKYESWL